MTTTLKLPRLRRDQYNIARHPAKVKVIAMGRRWGKSLMAGSVSMACMVKGGAVAWIVPTYKNARPVWRFVETQCASVPPIKLTRSDMSARMESGGRLTVYTADNDVAVRGEAFDLVVVDEAARIRGEVWTDAIMPTLADRDGKAMLISTPKGRNWFWLEFQKGLADGKEWASFTAPTSANPNPHIQRAAQAVKARVSERTYRQEWLAEFLDDGGIVFRYVRDCATLQPAPPQSNGQYVIGVDWARHNDSTVFCVMDVGRKAMAAQDRMTDIPYSQQLNRLAALHHYYNDAAIIAESNSIGDPLIEQCQSAGLPVIPFYTSDATKSVAIDKLASAFEKGQIKLIQDDTLLGELEAYEIKRVTSKSLPVYGAPDGMHDDCVMALALAWRMVGGGQSAGAWLTALDKAGLDLIAPEPEAPAARNPWLDAMDKDEATQTAPWFGPESRRIA